MILGRTDINADPFIYTALLLSQAKILKGTLCALMALVLLDVALTVGLYFMVVGSLHHCHISF